MIPRLLQRLARGTSDRRSERGTTAVEYGLMLVLIAAAVIAAAVFLSQQTQNTFDCTAATVRARSMAC